MTAESFFERLRQKLGGGEEFEPVEVDYDPLIGDDRVVVEQGNGGARSDLLYAEIDQHRYDVVASVGVNTDSEGVALDVSVNGEGSEVSEDLHIGALAALPPADARRVAQNILEAADVAEGEYE